MRKTFGATALLTIALLAVGCKKGDPLVGKWTGALQGQAMPPGASAIYEFKADKTMSFVTSKPPVTMTVSGDYKVEGENLTITFKDVQATGLPKQTEAMLPMIKQSLTAKPVLGKIKVISDDEISLTSADGKSGTLTRVKG